MKQESDIDDAYKIYVDEDLIIDSSGSAYFVVLAEDLAGDLAVRYGTGDKASAPYFSKPITIAYNSKIKCFGITLISSDVAIIDCIKSNGGAT